MDNERLKVVLTRRWPEAVERELEQIFDVSLRQEDGPMSRDELSQALKEADILCPTVTDRIEGDMLRDPQVRVRLIANFGVGFNHIDVAAAAERNISVTNTPGVLTQATAEIAMTLILTCARRTGEGERLVRSGKWQGWHPTHMLSTQVSGKVLGIVGMGRIGIALARMAHHGFGMQILYFGRSEVAPEVAAELGAARVSLEALLGQSDFVSLHCPATPETHHLINADNLACMQPHAFLINTARGDVISEADLADALAGGGIAGAGLDVYESEPTVHHALYECPQAVLLPHMGSGTLQTREAMGRCALHNMQALLAGQALPNKVV